jgi:HEAT repeat protein
LTTSLGVLLIGTALILLVMLALVSARKLLRDRREELSRRRVVALREVLVEGTPDEVRAALRGVDGVRAELDFVRVMDWLCSDGPIARLGVVQAAALEAGFVARHEKRHGAADPTVRGRSVLVVSRLRLPDTAERLAPLLTDPDPDVRLTVCAGLGATKDPRVVPGLLDALADGLLQSERVIERIGAPWAVDALLEELENRLAPGADVRVVAAIARALGAAGDPRAESALLGLFVRGSEEQRISAGRALGAIGARRSVPALIAALDDSSWVIRSQAAKSLGALGAGEAVQALEAALADQAWWVRANAATSLRHLGEAGMAALRRAAQSEDRFARDRAREALSLVTPGREPVVGTLTLAPVPDPATNVAV